MRKRIWLYTQYVRPGRRARDFSIIQPLELITEAGRATGIRVVRIELGEPGERGHRVPKVIDDPEQIATTTLWYGEIIKP